MLTGALAPVKTKSYEIAIEVFCKVTDSITLGIAVKILGPFLIIGISHHEPIIWPRFASSKEALMMVRRRHENRAGHFLKARATINRRTLPAGPLTQARRF